MEKIVARTKAYLERNERISVDDALHLFEIKDTSILAKLARITRERKHGKKSYYSSKPTIFISPTSSINGLINIYSKFLNEEKSGVSFSFSTEFSSQEYSSDAVLQIANDLQNNFSNPQFNLSNDYIYQKSLQENITPQDLLHKFKGLNNLVTYDDFTNNCSPEDRFLIWQSACKQAAVPVAGVQYKIIEDINDYVAQLEAIRILQDDLNLFDIVMPYPINNPLATELHLSSPTAAQTFRIVAITRIFLDNILHIAVPANVIKPELSFVSLSYGADSVINFLTDQFIPTNSVMDNGLNILSNEQIFMDNSSEAERLVGNSLKFKSRINESKWIATELDFKPITV